MRKMWEWIIKYSKYLWIFVIIAVFYLVKYLLNLIGFGKKTLRNSMKIKLINTKKNEDSAKNVQKIIDEYKNALKELMK
jgi:hypothetical protein